MALHTTAITPATSVLKIRICGDSGSGTVSTLPRGTMIATFAGFPRNFNSAYHEPLLLGVPDQWTIIGPFYDYWRNNTVDQCRQFVPLVLAEELTVRRQQGHYWADVHASVVISGCSELMAMFDKDDIPRAADSANKVFWAGSQLYVKYDRNAAGKVEMKIVRSEANRVANPGTLPGIVATVAANAAALLAGGGAVPNPIPRFYPLGTLVFPPNELSTSSRSLYSNVYISSLMGMQIREANYNLAIDHGVPPVAR